MTCILDILVENLTARHFTTSYYSMGVANRPFYPGYSLCAKARRDGERCPFCRVPVCPLFRGFQCPMYKIIQSGQSQVSDMSWVYTVEGCLLVWFHCIHCVHNELIFAGDSWHRCGKIQHQLFSR